ncbi:Inhibitor of vertebrate lysozyme (Ivy) [Rhizobiales bacterium GAS188]|nr:Inhibitor of vertebrate lysozyme (Ivy) [Rhizobiales bacterium GAS188]
MMRLARSALTGIALCGLVAGGFATSASARAGAYLLDLIKTEPYRGAWTRMLAKEHDVPSWIKDFVATGDGVNTPAHMVPVGVKAYTLATLCKAHDCADNMLYVIFAPDGSQAYARLVQAGKAPRLFGKPDAQVQSALSGAQ